MNGILPPDKIDSRSLHEPYKDVVGDLKFNIQELIGVYCFVPFDEEALGYIERTLVELTIPLDLICEFCHAIAVYDKKYLLQKLFY